MKNKLANCSRLCYIKWGAARLNHATIERRCGMTKEGHFSFFQNRECEYFPCHKTEQSGDFNCLFCYCPLYALGRRCGGNFRYTDSGIKDCSDCLIHHRRENYAYITGRYREIMDLVREMDARECESSKKKKNEGDA